MRITSTARVLLVLAAIACAVTWGIQLNALPLRPVLGSAGVGELVVRIHLRPGTAFLKNATVQVDGRQVFASIRDRPLGYIDFFTANTPIEKADFVLELSDGDVTFDSYGEVYAGHVEEGRHSWEFSYEGGRSAVNLDDSCAARFGLMVDPRAPYPENRPHEWYQSRSIARAISVRSGARHIVNIAPFDEEDREVECRVGRFIGVTSIMRTRVEYRITEE